ncbi:MAG: hypothetical protein Aurels2KO_55400 [Aureliella sp.]
MFGMEPDSGRLMDDRYRGTKAYDTVRQLLIDAAQQPDRFVSYGEVRDAAGITASGKVLRFEIRQILGEITEDEYLAGRPLLSAIATKSNEIRPGDGFCRLAKVLGRQNEKTNDLDFWIKELAAVRAYWAHEASATRDNESSQPATGEKPKPLALKHVFADRIRVPLRNPQWSWGVYDQENNRVILRVWKIEIDEEANTVFVAKDLDDPRLGAAERKTHIELIEAGAEAFGIICVAKIKPDGSRGIRGYDDQKVAELGDLVRLDGKTHAKITGWVPIATLFRAPSTNDELAKDLQGLKRNKEIDETTRVALTSARVGQGQFRAEVLRLWQNACAVSGVTTPECLRASHIRPWKDSTNEQRLDPFNGLPLIGTLDLLFDRGLITFDDDGSMVVSNLLTRSDKEKMNLSASTILRQSVSPETANYLRWHREHCFRTVVDQ